MIVSLKVEENKDDYGYEKITCMEKPIGIILDACEQGYSSLFYMIIKYLQAYYINGYDYDHYDQKNSEKLITQVLIDFFELDIKYENIDPNQIINWTEDHINKNHIVCVPLNLKYLFYSKYYKQIDWGHVNLIYGYQKEKELFYNLDSIQAYMESRAKYKPFVVDYSMFETMYTSWTQLGSLYPCYFDCNQIGNLASVDRILTKFARTYVENNNLGGLKEEVLMKQQFMDAENVQKYTELLMRITSAKQVFYNELVKFMEMYRIRTDILQEYKQITTELVQMWDELEYIISVKAYRKQGNTDYSSEYERIRNKEVLVMNMTNEICQCILERKTFTVSS